MPRTIHLSDTDPGYVGPGKTYLCDPPHVRGTILLEFDRHWRLIGLEVMGATQVLPPDLLKQVRPRP